MRLAIDGLGIVGPFGPGSEALRRATQAESLPQQADVGDLARFFSKRQLRRVSHFCRLALLGAALAEQDGGLVEGDREKGGWDEGVREGTGLIVATGHGPVTTTFDFLDSMNEFGPKLASPTAFSTSIHNVAASTISIMLGYTGPCLSVNQFSLSWASALMSAACWLAERRVKRVLVGAVDECQPLLLEAGRQAGCALATGEGAVFLLLSLDGPGRHGFVTDVAMGAGDGDPSPAELPFELPAGPAFATAMALLEGDFERPLTAVEPSGAWSRIVLQGPTP